MSANLVNVRAGERETQRFMRHEVSGPTGLAQSLYAVLPDVFDALVFFSTYKLEQIPQESIENFVAGIHTWAKTSYTGTGLGAIDLTDDYGSDGRLQSVNALDAYDRGIVSKTFMHELLHQWACFLDPGLGICDGAHYSPRSSAGSLVGGFQWTPSGNGSFTAVCAEGRNGAHLASPIDLYLSRVARSAGSRARACVHDVGFGAGQVRRRADRAFRDRRDHDGRAICRIVTARACPGPQTRSATSTWASSSRAWIGC